MYFHDRHQAGRMLASQLITKYLNENCVVIAVDEGGAIVGSEIAAQLHCPINAVINKQIDLPQEPVSVGGITTDGQFVYNPAYSKLELDEMEQENRAYMEEQKITKFHEANRFLSEAELVDKRVIIDRYVILASDGLDSPFKLGLALAFIKTVQYQRLIVAIPLASVSVVDWMHIYADEIYCLSVVEDYMGTGHYYDVQDKLDDTVVVKTISSSSGSLNLK